MIRKLIMRNIKFSIGYFEFPIEPGKSEMFLSVTPDLYRGPAIIRDGIKPPSMLHPDYFQDMDKDPSRFRELTSDENEQRSRCWTLYHHLQRFHERTSGEWNIIGAQGFGDLTMNKYHLAIIKDPRMIDQSFYEGRSSEPSTMFCRLDLRIKEMGDFNEEWDNQKYMALIINNSGDIFFRNVILQENPKESEEPIIHYEGEEGEQNDKINLLMIGKPIVENNNVMHLEQVIDKFQDIRHIFACVRNPLPKVNANEPDKYIVFGEFDLYQDINRRRQALSTPVQIEANLNVPWITIIKSLKDEGYIEIDSIPKIPGQFKVIKQNITKTKAIDIFFKRNFYPFSAIGLKNKINGKDEKDTIVCLAAMGQQFRIGETVDSVAQKMAQYGNCSHAMIMDEGFDVFQLFNMKEINKGEYVQKYSNETLLNIVAQTMMSRLIEDDLKQETESFPPMSIRKIEGDRLLIEDIERAVEGLEGKILKKKAEKVFNLMPQRMQIRSMLIFAQRK
jgi:hypothetical protein